MTYAYDPEITPWLSMLPSGPVTDSQELRTRSKETVRGGLPSYGPDIAIIKRDVTVPGSHGSPDVTIRVYAPAEPDGLLPKLFYIHGGGFIMGSIEQFDATATRIAAEVGAVVISVEYRLAPENPFPAGLQHFRMVQVRSDRPGSEVSPVWCAWPGVAVAPTTLEQRLSACSLTRERYVGRKTVGARRAGRSGRGDFFSRPGPQEVWRHRHDSSRG